MSQDNQHSADKNSKAKASLLALARLLARQAALDVFCDSLPTSSPQPAEEENSNVSPR